MKSFKEFIIEDVPASSVANVQDLQTTPLVRKKTQLKYVRRNCAATTSK